MYYILKLSKFNGVKLIMDSILTDILDIQNKIWDIGCNIKINQEEFECLSKAMKELKILYNKISDRQQEENI